MSPSMPRLTVQLSTLGSSFSWITDEVYVEIQLLKKLGRMGVKDQWDALVFDDDAFEYPW